jgi:hypothetical protein
MFFFVGQLVGIDAVGNTLLGLFAEARTQAHLPDTLCLESLVPTLLAAGTALCSGRHSNTDHLCLCAAGLVHVWVRAAGAP